MLLSKARRNPALRRKSKKVGITACDPIWKAAKKHKKGKKGRQR